MSPPLEISKEVNPMALPRSKYVQEGQEGVYHCFSRCVRRAFLYGFDALTRRDFSHRKAWLVDRLRYLAAIFAIEVCAYAVMENHYHTILRTRPDIVAIWSDREVATRWLTLFPRHRQRNGRPDAACRERNLRPGGLSGTHRPAAPTPVQPELVHGPAERIHRPRCKQRG